MLPGPYVGSAWHCESLVHVPHVLAVVAPQICPAVQLLSPWQLPGTQAPPLQMYGLDVLPYAVVQAVSSVVSAHGEQNPVLAQRPFTLPAVHFDPLGEQATGASFAFVSPGESETDVSPPVDVSEPVPVSLPLPLSFCTVPSAAPSSPPSGVPAIVVSSPPHAATSVPVIAAHPTAIEIEVMVRRFISPSLMWADAPPLGARPGGYDSTSRAPHRDSRARAKRRGRAYFFEE
jgi:hypothetical protein